jgi:hypothetical protein
MGEATSPASLDRDGASPQPVPARAGGRYQLCGFVLESNVSLPELEPIQGREVEYSFQLLSPSAPKPFAECWLHHHVQSRGEVWLSLGKHGGGYLLRFPDLADFVAVGREIRCFPTDTLPAETIRHFLLDLVMPLLLSGRGKLVLHASAVVVAGEALAFVGPTGRGKSTLTACFGARGFPLLADDCLVLQEVQGQFMATPNYGGLRLWPDSITALFDREPKLAAMAGDSEKLRLGTETGRVRFHREPVRLRRIYVLESPDDGTAVQGVVVGRASPRDACLELAKHTFRLDVTDRQRLLEEFDLLGRVAGSIPVCRLVYPRDFTRITAVCEAVVTDMPE